MTNRLKNDSVPEVERSGSDYESAARDHGVVGTREIVRWAVVGYDNEAVRHCGIDRN